jgi:hypothetical protein
MTIGFVFTWLLVLFVGAVSEMVRRAGVTPSELTELLPWVLAGALTGIGSVIGAINKYGPRIGL